MKKTPFFKGVLHKNKSLHSSMLTSAFLPLNASLDIIKRSLFIFLYIYIHKQDISIIRSSLSVSLDSH